MSFRSREDADDALQAMDDSLLEGVRISVAWGRALKDQPGAGGVGSTAASRSAYGRTAAPKPPANPTVAAALEKARMLAAQPPKRVASAAGGASAFQGAALSMRRSRWDQVHTQSGDGLSQSDFDQAHKVVVVAPSDDTLRRLADLTARFVAADGRTFEDFIRLRERDHGDFSQLLDVSSQVGRYYRYRAWEAAMARRAPSRSASTTLRGGASRPTASSAAGPSGSRPTWRPPHNRWMR